MNDPQRLLQGGGTEVERTLLEAGLQEEPSHRSMRNAAAALGLGAAAGLSAHSAAGAGAATIIVQLTEALKWVGAGLVGVGVVTAIGYTVVSRNAEPPPRQPVPQQVVAVTPPRHEAKPSMPPVEAKAGESREKAAPRPVTSVKKAPKPPGGSLKDQVALVDEARKELGSGQPQAALTTLNRYNREFPKGALGQEAMLLRIEALAQMGNRSAARTLATRFLTSQPSSPHRKRIESLVGKIDVPE
jgi:hypothetical protein